MFLLGTLVNAGSVLLATVLGALLRRGIPDRVTALLQSAMGLVVLYFGFDGIVSYATSEYAASAGDFSAVSVLLAVVLGTILGSLLRIEEHVNALGCRVEQRFAGKSGDGRFARGFVGCTLLFCVGAMSIIGEIRGGMFGDHRLIYVKSVMDSLFGLTMASTLGFGCALSALAILLYQGTIATVSFAVRATVGTGMSAETLAAMPAFSQMGLIGALLMIALGLNLLGITKIRVADLLPALAFPFLLCLFPFFR